MDGSWGVTSEGGWGSPHVLVKLHMSEYTHSKYIKLLWTAFWLNFIESCCFYMKMSVLVEYIFQWWDTRRQWKVGQLNLSHEMGARQPFLSLRTCFSYIGTDELPLPACFPLPFCLPLHLPTPPHPASFSLCPIGWPQLEILFAFVCHYTWGLAFLKEILSSEL